MGVTILVCTCGRRLKAVGLTPGQRGRCPSCGASIRAPEQTPAPGPEPEPVASGADVEEDEWNWQGTYDVGDAVRPRPLRRRQADEFPLPQPLPAVPAESVPEDFWSDDLVMSETPPAVSPPPTPLEGPEDEWDWRGSNYHLGETAAPRSREAARQAEDEGPAPIPAPIGWTNGEKDEAPREPEPWFPPRLFYPLRAAEALMPTATIGLACWGMATLVPTYCRTLQADAELLGAPLMGYLIGLITALPSLMLLPLVLVYWLQYLGRVLTASYECEPQPPRPPDRNFDGLFNGLGSWFVWGALGLGVGFGPLVAGWAAAAQLPELGLAPLANPTVLIAGGIGGFLYALMAFLITFLHDDPLEATPGRVLGGIGRRSPAFLGLALTVAGLLGLVAGAFAWAASLRSQSVWLFILASLPCWFLTVWASIVVMHTLGSYYGTHPPSSRQA